MKKMITALVLGFALTTMVGIWHARAQVCVGPLCFGQQQYDPYRGGYGYRDPYRGRGGWSHDYNRGFGGGYDRRRSFDQQRGRRR